MILSVQYIKSSFSSQVVSPLLALSEAGHDAFSKRGFDYLTYMAVKTPIDNTEGLYFITFTCQNFRPPRGLAPTTSTTQLKGAGSIFLP